eukprot:203285_1
MAQQNEQQQQQLISMLLQSLSGMDGNVMNGGGIVPPQNKKKPPASQYALEKQCIDVEITKKELKTHKKCSICVRKFKLGGDATMLDPCKHIFHDLCILRWLRENNTCPLCRKELLTVDYDYESSKWEDKQDPSPPNNNNNVNNTSNFSMYV